MNEELKRRLAIYQSICGRAGREFVKSETPVIFAQADDDFVEARISGVFDSYWGFDYRDFIAELDERNPSSLRVLIDSPGGHVHDGMALYHDLSRRKEKGMKLQTEAVGLVASAAVLPYMAADERIIRTGSMMMIHSVWGFAFVMGNADEMEKEMTSQVNAMRKHDKNYRQIMVARAKMKDDEIEEKMKAETWYSADEAMDDNLATEIVEAKDEEDDNISGSAGADPAMMAGALSVLAQYKIFKRG